MLKLQDIHAYYGKSHVLHGVNFQVGGGEIVALLGRNGSGRSTTVKTIMGLVQGAGSIRCFHADPMHGDGTVDSMKRKCYCMSTR